MYFKRQTASCLLTPSSLDLRCLPFSSFLPCGERKRRERERERQRHPPHLVKPVSNQQRIPNVKIQL